MVIIEIVSKKTGHVHMVTRLNELLEFIHITVLQTTLRVAFSELVLRELVACMFGHGVQDAFVLESILETEIWPDLL